MGKIDTFAMRTVREGSTYFVVRLPYACFFAILYHNFFMGLEYFERSNAK